jgi:MFS transporter, BCD family, chlorophyll transporter
MTRVQSSNATKPLGWLSIVRLGMVQMSIGAVVALFTSTLNRVMSVEMGLPLMLPGALVALHYAMQMTRIRWGYGSDVGNKRTPWIIGGMGVLCLGSLGATDATLMMSSSQVAGTFVAMISYILIGLGVGATGTSLLAFMATRVAPDRRAAAASITWTMMVFGAVLSAVIVSKMIEPFSAQNLAFAASAVVGLAFVTTVIAVHKMEDDTNALPVNQEAVVLGSEAYSRTDFLAALKEIWQEPLARRFTIFVFLSMLAYSTQDLILEPFAGMVFNMTPSETSKMSGLQNGGGLIGMILVGVIGGRALDGNKGWMQTWTILGCIGSAIALLGICAAASIGTSFPLKLFVTMLGFFNGVFAISAIGSMMGLAGQGRNEREGLRMGIWGAAQAIATGLASFIGGASVDALRALSVPTNEAYLLVFAVEAIAFIAAAILASRLQMSKTSEFGNSIGLGVVSQ